MKITWIHMCMKLKVSLRNVPLAIDINKKKEQISLSPEKTYHLWLNATPLEILTMQTVWQKHRIAKNNLSPTDRQHMLYWCRSISQVFFFILRMVSWNTPWGFVLAGWLWDTHIIKCFRTHRHTIAAPFFPDIHHRGAPKVSLIQQKLSKNFLIQQKLSPPQVCFQHWNPPQGGIISQTLLHNGFKGETYVGWFQKIKFLGWFQK